MKKEKKRPPAAASRLPALDWQPVMTSAACSSRAETPRGSLFYLITAALLAAGQPLSHHSHHGPIRARQAASCEAARSRLQQVRAGQESRSKRRK